MVDFDFKWAADLQPALPDCSFKKANTVLCKTIEVGMTILALRH
jgi:hypothetical protein